MKKKIICFVAAHSGGHIIPCLTKARTLIDTKQADEILFFSTSSKRDQAIVCASGTLMHTVFLPLINLPRTNWWRMPLCIASLLYSFAVACFFLIKWRPTTIASTGGFVSIPVFFAGKLLRIPLELHELNAVPGSATRFLAPLAHTVAVTHPQAAPHLRRSAINHKAYPVRFTAADIVSQVQALHAFNFCKTRTTILVIGGSQGSVFLNNCIAQFVRNHPELMDRIQIIHQTGGAQEYDWQSFYAQHPVPAHTFDYHDNVSLAYQAADLIITRAGAGTLAEITFFKKIAIVIPLQTTSTNHQRANALAMQKENPKQTVVIDQQELAHNHSRFDQELIKRLPVAENQ